MRQTTQPRVPLWVNKASKSLTEKPVGVEAARETPSLTEFVGETHKVLGYTQTHPLGNLHLKGLISLWVEEEVTESQPRAKQAALVSPAPSYWTICCHLKKPRLYNLNKHTSHFYI